MAKSKDSIKRRSKTVSNLEFNPSKDSIKLKTKTEASSTIQPKGDITVRKTSKKSLHSTSKPIDADSTAKPGVKSSLKIYFPQQFSMLQNMEFLDHISDAENIIFDNSVYAVCKDVSTAEQICKSANGLQFQNGNNKIHSANRLGPAFCAFKRKEQDPTVLTIRKLPPGLSYQDLEIRFPKALDICLKKTMAKVKFADIDSCKHAWLCSANLVWPGGAVPTVGDSPCGNENVQLDEQVDPDDLKFGHPSKLVEDPCVIFILLQKRFELTKGMEVLDILKTATDIILSRSCTVVFSKSADAMKRRKLLAGHSVPGGNVVAWISGRPNDNDSDKKSRKRSNEPLTEPNVGSAEEKVMPPSAKKIKKKASE